ncbi:hypothetical protein HK405_009101 [Cladochytrium tenue]|nr:hypothetical protein HK405_009101 [Cladochytrium tenue]
MLGFFSAVPALEAAVGVFSEIVNKITLKSFSCENYENPTIQKHYENLQAIALKRDMAKEFYDQSLPNEFEIQKRLNKYMDRLVAAMPVAPAQPAAAPDGDGAAPAPKRTAAAVDIDEVRAMHEKGALKKLTVATLVEFLHSVGVQPMRKKSTHTHMRRAVVTSAKATCVPRAAVTAAVRGAAAASAARWVCCGSCRPSGSVSQARLSGTDRAWSSATARHSGNVRDGFSTTSLFTPAFQHRRHATAAVPALPSVAVVPGSAGSPAAARVDFGGGVVGSYPLAWLRDSCQCPRCVHPENHQKLHASSDVADFDAASAAGNPALLPAARIVAVEQGGSASSAAPSAQLHVDWPKGSLITAPDDPHTTVLSLDWLVSASAHPSNHPLLSIPAASDLPPPADASPASVAALAAAAAPMLWTAADFAASAAPRVDYAAFMGSDAGLWAALRQLRQYGLCFFDGVPTSDEREVERLARRFGCIRETFYGTSWDVKSVPQARNIAYTSLDLGLHMDLMYFEAPPGVQFLHSLKNTVTGGESYFADSFKAVQLLKESHPDDYDVLTRVPVTFHYHNDGHAMQYRRPTISLGDAQEPLRVYYSPPFQGPTRLGSDPALAARLHAALGRLAAILRDPALIYRSRLRPGDCVAFLNRRVLHARDEFDQQSGDRHFRGTYVDADDFRDRFAVTAAKVLAPK